MIYYRKGDMFETDVQAYTNPINCVSVMGAGLALEFKKLYPVMFNAYKSLCARGLIKTGRMWLWKDKETNKYIVNFPTKHHWQNPSRYSYILEGLIDLYGVILDNNIHSIAIPALGCGLGGLRWELVKELINEILDVEELKNVEIYVYEPV